MIEEYLKSVNIMDRGLERLPQVDAYAAEAMQSADEALEDTEKISARIMEMILMIQNELRVQVTEMQSFSPEEMMNVPRKSERDSSFLLPFFPPFVFYLPLLLSLLCTSLCTSLCITLFYFVSRARKYTTTTTFCTFPPFAL